MCTSLNITLSQPLSTTTYWGKPTLYNQVIIATITHNDSSRVLRLSRFVCHHDKQHFLSFCAAPLNTLAYPTATASVIPRTTYHFQPLQPLFSRSQASRVTNGAPSGVIGDLVPPLTHSLTHSLIDQRHTPSFSKCVRFDIPSWIHATSTRNSEDELLVKRIGWEMKQQPDIHMSEQDASRTSVDPWN